MMMNELRVLKLSGSPVMSWHISALMVDSDLNPRHPRQPVPKENQVQRAAFHLNLKRKT